MRHPVYSVLVSLTTAYSVCIVEKGFPNDIIQQFEPPYYAGGKKVAASKIHDILGNQTSLNLLREEENIRKAIQDGCTTTAVDEVQEATVEG